MAVLEKLSWPNALIVAPLTAVDSVWVVALENSGYTICRSLQDVAEASGPIALVVHWQAFTKLAKRLAKLPWQIVIIDESQGLKARASGQSRAARRFRNFPRRIALSGTPIDDSPIDVWGQMRFVNHNVLGENWTEFADDFCHKAGFMGKAWVFTESERPRFLKLLKPHIYRLTVGFLKLKPIHLHPIPFDLLGEQDRLYRQMEQTGIIRIGSKRIVADLAITNLGKREQITGGYVLDDEDIPRFTGRAKERKLRWLLGRIKPPVVVFCRYRHEMTLIKRVLLEFMPRVRLLHGGVKDKDDDKQRSDLLRSFQAGELDALICQTRTGGVAIDLTRASELIFYSINHSYIDFEQTLFRLYGKNQKNALNAYFLYAVDTVDEEKLQVVKDKESAAYNVVSHFERESVMEVKDKAAAKKAPAKKVAPKKAAAKADAPKYGVAELAKKMGVEAATARLKLRAGKVKKSGKSYGWNSQGELDKVAKQLSA